MHRKSTKDLEREKLIAQLRQAGQSGPAYQAAPPSQARPPRQGIPPQALQAAIPQFSGRLVLPTSPSYEQDRQQSDPAFQNYPALIAYCEVLDDIAWCLKYAQAWGLPISCRSGGHSTAGYAVVTDGIVIDMTAFNYVMVNPADQTVLVGSGTPFEKLYAALDPYNLVVPGGECGDVCVGGYMQGGGYGFAAREFGINCDNVLQARVMVYDNDGIHLVTASQNENYDLLWAICGGTGNNFGVLVDVVYKAHPVQSPMWAFTLKWTDPNAIPQALLAVQDGYSRTGPQGLGVQGVLMVQSGDSSPSYQLSGLYDGPRSAGYALISPLLSIGQPVLKEYQGSYRYLNDTILPGPNFPPNTTNAYELKQSSYIAQPIDLAGWQAIVQGFDQRPAGNNANAVFFEYYGGAINSFPRGANAFIHRDVYMDIYVDSFWFQPQDEGAASEWLDSYMAMLSRYGNGHQYQNYPRPGMVDYQWAYWGPAFWTLLSIRGKYDPLNLFDFPQAIKLPPAGQSRVYENEVPLEQRQPYYPPQPISYDPYYPEYLARYPYASADAAPPAAGQ